VVSSPVKKLPGELKLDWFFHGASSRARATNRLFQRAVSSIRLACRASNACVGPSLFPAGSRAMDFTLREVVVRKPATTSWRTPATPTGSAAPTAAAIATPSTALTANLSSTTVVRVVGSSTPGLARLHSNQRTPAQIVLIVRGIVPGTPTAKLACELGCSRRLLLDLRHRLEHDAHATRRCRRPSVVPLSRRRGTYSPTGTRKKWVAVPLVIRLLFLVGVQFAPAVL